MIKISNKLEGELSKRDEQHWQRLMQEPICQPLVWCVGLHFAYLRKQEWLTNTPPKCWSLASRVIYSPYDADSSRVSNSCFDNSLSK